MRKDTKSFIIILCGIIAAVIVVLAISLIVLPNNKSNDEKENIGKEKAYTIAMNDAEVSKDDVNYKKCELELEDGVEVYNIEFIDDNMKYEYEISGKTGEILSTDRERISSIS